MRKILTSLSEKSVQEACMKYQGLWKSIKQFDPHGCICELVGAVSNCKSMTAKANGKSPKETSRSVLEPSERTQSVSFKR